MPRGAKWEDQRLLFPPVSTQSRGLTPAQAGCCPCPQPEDLCWGSKGQDLSTTDCTVLPGSLGFTWNRAWRSSGLNQGKRCLRKALLESHPCLVIWDHQAGIIRAERAEGIYNKFMSGEQKSYYLKGSKHHLWSNVECIYSKLLWLKEGLRRWLSGKDFTCQCQRQRFDPWVGKIPWRRKWQSTPLVLPGKSHGQANLAGYSPWDHKEMDMTEQLNTGSKITLRFKNKTGVFLDGSVAKTQHFQ